MVGEGAVLLRIEHLQERARWIAVEVGAQLVDLVQHEQRIARAGAADAAQDVAWQRADVGAAMPADLRLVTHAAERDALELAADGTGDRATERRLAGARGPDEAQDRRARVALEAAHREEFEDALFDLVQPVMVLVEDRPCMLEVEVVLGRDGPRHLAHPFQVGTGHRVLGRLRRDAGQPRQLAVGLAPHLLRHVGLLDLFLELVDLAPRFVTLAQLLLDRLELLAEQEFLLPLVERLLHLLLDLLAHLEHLVLARQDLGERMEALLHVLHFEQRLLHVRGELQQRGQEIGQPARRTLVLGRHQHLGRQRGRDRDDALELREQRLREPRRLDVVHLRVVDGGDLGGQVGLGAHHLVEVHPSQPLDQDRHLFVRHADHAQHDRQRADAMEVRVARVLRRRLALREYRDGAVGRHRVVQHPQAFRSADVERQEGEREQHGVAYRQDRHLAWRERHGGGLGERFSADLDLLRAPGKHVHRGRPFGGAARAARRGRFARGTRTPRLLFGIAAAPRESSWLGPAHAAHVVGPLMGTSTAGGATDAGIRISSMPSW